MKRQHTDGDSLERDTKHFKKDLTAHPFSSETLLHIASFMTSQAKDMFTLELVSSSWHETISHNDQLWKSCCAFVLKQHAWTRMINGKERSIDMYEHLIHDSKLSNWKNVYRTM